MSFVIQKHSLVDRGELHRAICCFVFLFLVSVRLVVFLFCFFLFIKQNNNQVKTVICFFYLTGVFEKSYIRDKLTNDP